MATQAFAIDALVRPLPTQAVERRTHPRLPASELRGLKVARVKYGPDIKVIDLSPGGVLFETPEVLRPDSIIVLEFATHTGTVVVPSRLLRCERVWHNYDIRHKAACAFRRPLPLDGFMAAGTDAHANKRSSTWQHVVARFRDGRLMPGFTNDFHPSKPYLNLSTAPASADARFTQVAQMEALYFLRDGNEGTRTNSTASVSVAHGRQIEVTLSNGDIIVGSTLNYRRDGSGFFIHPSDPNSEYSRIFLTSAGIRHVRFL